MLSRQSLAAAMLACVVAPSIVAAQAVRSGFNTTSDGRNDDGTYTAPTGCTNPAGGGTCSGTLVPIGFTGNLFGTSFSGVYINTNGNVTLTSPFSTFTPSAITGGGIPPMLAPFFADVDTRSSGSGVVQFGTGMVGGENAFGVTWPSVGYFDSHSNKLNIFQLVLINRNDTGAGNFDFEFNYGQIQWETGDASNGSNGLGGICAHAGYSNGLSGASNVSFELAGSGVCGAFLDGGPDALKSHSLNSDVAGRYVFMVRNGTVSSTVPEPSSLALLGSGLFGLVPMIRRRRR